MYRIDHIAFRTFDRKKAVKFFKDAMGYREQAEFTICFDKNDSAICSALEPTGRVKSAPWACMIPVEMVQQEYVLAPEIFVSEGTEGSIVWNWCKTHGPGLHHVALQVPADSTVEAEMKRWLDNGWAEEGFSSDAIKCDDLCQVFTKPSSVLGVVFELIQRKEAGFCRDSVKQLMESSVRD